MNIRAALSFLQRMRFVDRMGWGAVAVVALATLASIYLQTPGIGSDASWGVLCAEEYHAGKSQSIRYLAQADSANLDRDKPVLVSWYPPGYQLIPFLFREIGFSLGVAIKLTTLLAWGIGITGWAGYFYLVLQDRRLLPWCLLCFMLFRYSHSNAHIYNGGELMLWSFFPWVFLLNIHAMTQAGSQRGRIDSVVAGACSVLLFVIKYSAGLISVALAGAWAWMALSGKIRMRFAACHGTGCLLSCLLLVALNIPGGPTPAGGVPGAPVLKPPLWAALWPWSALPLAATDLDSLVRWLWLHPTWPTGVGDGDLTDLGLALLLLGFLVWLAGRRVSSAQATKMLPSLDSDPALRRLALATLIGVPAILSYLILTGGNVGLEARYVRMPAILALPFIVNFLTPLVCSAGWLRRIMASVALIILFLVPAGYGATTLIEKTWFRRLAGASLVGSTGIRVDSLGVGADAKGFYKELMTLAPGPNRVLYVTEPDIAYELVGRRLIVEEGYYAIEQLERRRNGSPAGGVALALPRRFEKNGKLEVIRDSFIEIKKWEQRAFKCAPEFTLWIGQP